ncbi:uncharacterized protein PGTG_21850 [Puccinia graminis f. sp. tritici CRL 75-36-700-3]|uniref:Uncharacterized protein n=1 Tax=Puccinia graminis f. sp. tritici (strain CRL 75-36-700-3 / race SCCL) TaxID=418459 RepID=H6QSK8_PUCGT|nr:uncharacterized protein PGTG_21850 [Puccinia graminis f. sp. tritici CRL 75-36-700-3]EHS63759.1 hypothetical protein PGTG_21850 [Puccinia graminis f. sp. tritici CRL 75-36-700-3]
MSEKDKIQNRSLSCSSNFRPLEPYTSAIKPGQLYGPISTPSYVTCNAIDPVDYRIMLNTSGSVDHSLFPEFIYTVPDKILLLNSPSLPILNYYLDLVAKICPASDQIEDSTNKTFTSGVGLVTFICKPNEDEPDEIKTSKKHDLSIHVTHTDWDPIVQFIVCALLVLALC